MRPSRSGSARFVTVLAVAVLLLVACGGTDDGESPGAATTIPTTTSTSATTPTTRPPLVLEPDGIGVVVDPSRGTIRHLTFGEVGIGPTSTVLTLARGEELGRDDLPECGEGPLVAVRHPGITTYYADEALAGWASDARELTTVGGIGIGSTRADLEAAFPSLEVDETSLGLEWRSGSLSGTLTADTSEATVAELWAGRTCIAR